MTAISTDILMKNIYPPMKDDEELWKFFDIVNCYSYALGLLFDISFLQPGQISKMEKKTQYTDNELIERVKRDIYSLKMEIRESSFEEVITDVNSWKIAILNTGLTSYESLYDYHFVKQYPNKEWYHKLPYEQFPTSQDSWNCTIKNPETARYSFKYHLVGYFVVTKF